MAIELHEYKPRREGKPAPRIVTEANTDLTSAINLDGQLDMNQTRGHTTGSRLLVQRKQESIEKNIEQEAAELKKRGDALEMGRLWMKCKTSQAAGGTCVCGRGPCILTGKKFCYGCYKALERGRGKSDPFTNNGCGKTKCNKEEYVVPDGAQN